MQKIRGTIRNDYWDIIANNSESSHKIAYRIAAERRRGVNKSWGDELSQLRCNSLAVQIAERVLSQDWGELSYPDAIINEVLTYKIGLKTYPCVWMGGLDGYYSIEALVINDRVGAILGRLASAKDQPRWICYNGVLRQWDGHGKYLTFPKTNIQDIKFTENNALERGFRENEQESSLERWL